MAGTGWEWGQPDGDGVGMEKYVRVGVGMEQISVPVSLSSATSYLGYIVAGLTLLQPRGLL